MHSTLRMAAVESIAGTSIRLPCGLVLKNRMVKTAMSEKTAVGGEPTPMHDKIYKTWAQGGWAALITGVCLIPY